MKNIVKNPLDDYQLLEMKDKSFYFANVDTVGVETTTTLENTAKPYVINEETGEPGVITGEPLNVVPRDNNDEGVYYNTSDVYYHPEYTYVESIPEKQEDDKDDSGSTVTSSATTTTNETSGETISTSGTTQQPVVEPEEEP